MYLRNGCHRSPFTWSRLATLPGSTSTVGSRANTWDPTLDYHLLACSGAQTYNVEYQGQYGELSMNAGFCDENTTLVTLSIGGNDAGFSRILRECAAPWKRPQHELRDAPRPR